MASRDSAMAYDLHVRVQPHGNFTRSKMPERDRLYLMGVKGKVSYMNQILKEFSAAHQAEDEWILFTDLDVVPLRPFSSLPPLRPDSTSKASLWFMQEIHQLRGPLGSWAVNSGFYLLRNTKAVRRFVHDWHGMLTSNKKLRDQDAANFLLNKGTPTKGFAWASFDEADVTGNASRVDSRTVAFHAIHARWPSDKVHRLREALARYRAANANQLPDHRVYEQQMCEPSDGCDT
jgi:hypothetical protein